MSKTIVVAFGRFQPPTIGHDNIINEVLFLAKLNKCDHMIWVSTSHDNKTNPLSIMDKTLLILERKVSITLHNNIFIFMENLIKDGYDNVIVVAGSDRICIYKNIFPKYHKIQFSFVEVNRKFINISGTMMRDFVKNNDKNDFIKYLSSYIPNNLKEETFRKMKDELSGINQSKT